MLTLYYLGEKLSGGVKDYPAAENLAGRARVGQKIEKKSENCRTVPKLPYSKFNTLRDPSISLYVNKNTILIH